jgi:hypothetical protein
LDRVKWWHWALLGLGVVMFAGGIIYGLVAGAF